MHIESDENGFWLIHETGAIPVDDPERLYDSVKGQIGPWLRERDEAQRAYRAHIGAFHCDPDESGGYALDDPKSKGYHDRMSAIWDNREGK